MRLRWRICHLTSADCVSELVVVQRQTRLSFFCIVQVLNRIHDLFSSTFSHPVTSVWLWLIVHSLQTVPVLFILCGLISHPADCIETWDCVKQCGQIRAFNLWKGGFIACHMLLNKSKQPPLCLYFWSTTCGCSKEWKQEDLLLTSAAVKHPG